MLDLDQLLLAGGWRLDLDLAKEGNKSREQLRCRPVLSQPRHGRRVQPGPSLIVFKTIGLFSGLSLLQKITYLGRIVAQCTVGQGGH